MTQVLDDLLSLEQAAEVLGISKSTVYRLLDQGKVKGMKAGKQWRFLRGDLVTYLERGSAALALAQVPAELLDRELAIFADGLLKLGEPLPEEMVDTEDEEGKVRTLVLQMIQLLRVRHASDLHLEPIWENGTEVLLVRLRVNGPLHEVCRMPIALLKPLLHQWKSMAGLDPDACGRPQHGNIQLSFGDQLARFRVAVLPTIYGEALTVRTIPTHVPRMEDLFPDPYLGQFRRWISRNRGIILFTGPTGSGKTTSLVSCLCDLVTPQQKAIAVENPVEYLLPNVMQVQVEGFSLADALRAVEEHDPDVILVGELRDAEMAQRAVHFAETGRLVFAVMHVYEAVTALHRLAEWGIDRSLLSMNLVGLTTQTLVRKLCPHCRKPADHAPAYLHTMRRLCREGGYPVADDARFFIAPGCAHCHNTGYLGRTVMEEALEMTQETRLAFVERMPIDEFRKLSIEYGLRTLFAEGIRLATEGVTSLEEVYRVTGA